MCKREFFLSLFFSFAVLLSFAQTAYTFTAHKNVVKDSYNFWISEPDTYADRDSAMPIVLFLHGASLCGNDLNRVRKYGCLDAISMGRDINAIIIAPQNPGGSWNSNKMLDILNWTIDHYDVDTNRIYLIGMSLGGFGTIEFLANHGEKIAASMELCGGTIRKDLCKLNNLPLWIIHGTADKAVPVARAQDIVNAMRNCGKTDLLRFDKWPGVNHSQLAKLFYLDETYSWLFSHSKTDCPKQVNKTIDINIQDLARAYQNIDRTSNKIVIRNYDKSTNDMKRTDDWEDTTRTVLHTESQTQSAIDQTKAQPQSPKPSKPKTSYHIVKKGDTLYSIAKKHHTTVEKICRLNKIKETTILQIGRKLKVK